MFKEETTFGHIVRRDLQRGPTPDLPMDDGPWFNIGAVTEHDAVEQLIEESRRT